MAAEDDWDAEKMLDLYLHDYMMRKQMYNTAAIFRKEANVGNNPVVIVTPDGFLHEWWTLFYDMYAARHQMHQDAKGKGIVQEEQVAQNYERQNNNQIVPQMQYALTQQMPEQFTSATDVAKLLGQQSVTSMLRARMLEQGQQLRQPVGNLDPNLRPMSLDRQLVPSMSASTSSGYQQQQVCTQGQQQVPRDNRIGIGTSRFRTLDNNIYGAQRGTFPMNRSNNTGVNPVPLNGWLLKSLQASDHPQQYPVLPDQYQKSPLGQALALISENLQSALPGNHIIPDNRSLMLPSPSFNERDARMMAQMQQAEEYRKQYEQHMQLNLLENHSGRNKRKMLYLTAGDKNLDSAPANVDKSLEDNVEFFLSNHGANNKGTPFSTSRCGSTKGGRNDGLNFHEIGCLRLSNNKMLCSHFSSDGKLLASAGHDKKVSIWNMENFRFFNSTDEHSLPVTDIRFRSNSTILATSSFDKNVQIWDAAKPSKSLFKFLGHTEQVMSLDFNPRKGDLLCSCDVNDEIRLWNVNHSACIHAYKGATKQVRFRPQCDKLLATATGSNINIIEADIGNIHFTLKGHAQKVLSICWDASGEYIASVSEDRARIWSIISGGQCVHELHSNGNKFQCCTFHPGYSQLLIIGTYQSLEFWKPTEDNQTWSVQAHNEMVAALTDSIETKMVASASHDHCVKLWK